MQFYMRVITTSILLFLLGSCNERYNDLVDYGYKGKIKKVILIHYVNPVNSSGDWHADGEPRFTKTTLFNDKGMITEESYVLRERSYARKFIVKGDKKIECNETGHESGKSKFRYTNSSITEQHYDSSGELDYEAITFYDKKKLTTKEVYTYYSGKQIKDYNTTYYTNRIDGYISKYLFSDSIKNIRESFENVILGKDENGNPIKILIKKDGSPESLRVLKFEYE